MDLTHRGPMMAPGSSGTSSETRPSFASLSRTGTPGEQVHITTLLYFPLTSYRIPTRIDKLVAGAQSGVKIGITFVAAASSWSKERVLLLGDAAHAMLPFTGQGLSQGLEDVDLLSVLLSKNGLTPQSSGEPQELFPIIGKCFMMLQKMRSPRTNLISKAAIDNIDVFESADPEYVKTRDAKFAEPPNPGVSSAPCLRSWQTAELLTSALLTARPLVEEPDDLWPRLGL
jgi:FAD binding domain